MDRIRTATKTIVACATIAAVAVLACCAPVHADLVYEKLLRGRAVEAVIWGMPAVNCDLMLQEMLTKTAGKPNQFIYWGRPLDWHNQTLTPNPDTIYFMTFFDTKDVGPVVLEIPPSDADGSMNGNLVTTWQTSLEDVGLKGIDKGAGGKFLIVPPGWEGEVPAGYSPLRSDTFGGFLLGRVNLKSHRDADVAASIAYGRRMKLYPLSAAANPPGTVFTDVKDVDYDSTIRWDASFFRSLDRVVQREPWIERDRAMIDPLRTIGIEKGQSFAPDAATESILKDAVADAKEVLEARYDVGFPSFWEKSHWTMPALQEGIDGQATTYAKHDSYPIDARGLAYTYAYVAIKRLGAGQFYLISIRDAEGRPYDGSETYRLTVPPGVPIEQYWSVTAYDRQTHALIKNVSRASRSSQIPDLQKNADGSIDVWFGPKALAGKESNWVPTDPARGFELMFRLYGPKKEFFDKVWRLPDVMRLRAKPEEAIG